MANRAFDRSQEDFGNVLNMEHINLTVPDQQVAALFYVTGLGFTRDPYIDFGTFNMWINVGEQQFHLPKRTAQKFRGHIGVVVPDLEDLKRRLDFIDRPMQGTGFSRQEKDDHIPMVAPFEHIGVVDVALSWRSRVWAISKSQGRRAAPRRDGRDRTVPMRTATTTRTGRSPTRTATATRAD